MHGDKYDYSKVKYKTSYSKVEIVCPIHGSFYQIPKHHMNGSGCPMCDKSKKLNTKEFIKKAQAVHGNKYNYDKSNYIRALEKICITCPIHGDFWQENIIISENSMILNAYRIFKLIFSSRLIWANERESCSKR